MEHVFKCLPQFPRSLTAVQRTCIRLCSQMYIRYMDKSHRSALPFPFPVLLRSPSGRIAQKTRGRIPVIISAGHSAPLPVCNITFLFHFYSSQLFTVLGNGITSRMFDIPVRYITHLSNPRPNPACLVEPYFLRSR